ncbi:chaperonin 10-like protein [Aspergillus pseudoustus]|uniref:Chaperonin 10-like protein n=1 Tax=Aspergillus pseudoustus TaxID=1810923 RepID=A0ABR4K4L0_9EURO
MRTARFYAAGDVRVEDVEVPDAADDKVLVEVEWCGICGSDLNEYIQGPMAIPSPVTGPHHLTGDILPVSLGHELTGWVLRAPSDSGFAVGQPVVIDPRFYCSSCAACTHTATNCCSKLGFLGLSGGGGGLSEKIALPPAMLHALPEGTPLDAASLIEPLAVAWHAVRRANASTLSGVPILVIGGGPIGVATVFVLKAWGADRIYVSELAERRREFLAGIVDEAIDPTATDVAARCRHVTGGDGVSIVFDCAGSQRGLEVGCASLRFHGLYMNLSIPKAPLALPLHVFTPKELTYKSMLAYDETDFRETVAAFTKGKFAGVERMITARISLDDVVGDGFNALLHTPDAHIKILVTAKPQL